jgi:hypothetical protein
MRRTAQDALISVGALAVLLLGLVAIDARVREHADRIINGATSAGVGDQLTSIGSMVLVAARDQSVAHAPLAMFVVAAAVLLLAMLRT